MKKLYSLFFISVAVVGLMLLYFPQYKEKLKWDNYFSRTGLSEANKTVTQAINRGIYESPEKVVVLDLGAGNGNDTKYLLDQGFKVYAVDFHETAIKRINQRTDLNNKNNLRVIKSSFQEVPWDSLPKMDAIIAINSISFVDRDDFDLIWRAMRAQLKPGGLLIARLLGDHLQWQNTNHMSLLSKEEVLDLAKGCELLQLDEEKYSEDKIVQHAYNVILQCE